MNTAYSLSSLILPCLIYQIMMCKRKKIEYNKRPYVRHFIWCYIFIFYLYLIFEVTGLGSIWDIGKYDEIIRIDEINLIPFRSHGVMTYLLNMIMFMPLGFLLTFIWNERQEIKKVIIVSALFSCAIEICQLFNRRQTDIDDLIMNTLGAAFGYLIWKIYYGVFKVERDSVTLSAHEPEVYLILSLLGQFLLYNWRIFQY